MTLALSIFILYQAQGQILISLIFGDKLNSDKLEFGLDGGLALTNISNLEGADTKPGFHLGFYFDIKMSESLFLHTGVIAKSPMGADELPVYSLDDPALDSVFAEGSVVRKLRYFHVPVYLKYRFYDQFFLEAGPVVGLKNKSVDLFKASVETDDDLSFERKIKKDIASFDYGVTFGMGYKLLKGTGINLGVRYYLGLADILKNNPGDAQRNSAFYLFAGIPIGAGKVADEADPE